MEAIEEYQHAGCTIALYNHDDPISPREWTQLGVMACTYDNYDLGDEGPDGFTTIIRRVEEEEDEVAYEEDREPRPLSWEMVVDYLKRERGATVVLPLALYDHSGITMFVGGKGDYPFDSAGWDTSNIGVIFDTAKTREECGTPLDRVEEGLRAEVEEYDQYLTGQVYGYVVKKDGETLESCWGFMGDEGLKEAKKEAESCAENEARAESVVGFYALPH